MSSAPPWMFVTILILALTVAVQPQDMSKPPATSSRFGVKYDEALEAIFSVAVRLEALLAEVGGRESKNFMVSPLSVAAAIGELMLGARGSLQQQLYELLVIDPSENKSETVRHLKDNTTEMLQHHALHEQLGDLLHTLQKSGQDQGSYALQTASVLFTQLDLEIKADYKTNVLRFYGTEVRGVDFAGDPVTSERVVNQWARDNTRGLIQSILPGPVPRQTAAIMANAVYFKGDWEVPFSSEINRRGKFNTSATSSVNVTFMMGEFENYKYVDSRRLGCRMVVIPYEGNELAMYIVLPHENTEYTYDINKFTARLRTNDILELIRTARTRKVFLMLPRMALSNTISVLEPLRRYHKFKGHEQLRNRLNAINETDQYDRLDERVDVFKNTSGLSDKFRGAQDSTLDLSGISTDARFQLSEIYQQMTLSVHERGTEAAAVAASAIDYILESVSVRVDHPFLFFIRHEATEASLFWGTIVDPTEEH